MSTVPIIPTFLPPHKKDLPAGQALHKHLADAFNEGGSDNLNAELHSLCAALSQSTPEYEAFIDGWLVERARESQEAATVAKASFA